MAWTTPDEIAALFRSRGSAQSDQDEKSWRTAQLKEVLAAAREQNADGLAPVVEKLADGARDGELEPVVLFFFLFTSSVQFEVLILTLSCFQPHGDCPSETLGSSSSSSRPPPPRTPSTP